MLSVCVDNVSVYVQQVAASGGYYLGMGCDEIVAEELTVTGSIGVVTAKFNAEELNNRIGVSLRPCRVMEGMTTVFDFFMMFVWGDHFV